MDSCRLIMLPQDPGFQDFLSIPPPNWEQEIKEGDAFVASYEGGGVLKIVDWDTAMDYALGGEMDLIDEANSEVFTP